MPLSTIWEFSCKDAWGNDLCFNNGSCIVDLVFSTENVTLQIGERTLCTCSEGFEHDFDWFHNKNCAKPINSTRNFMIFYAFQQLLVIMFYCVRIHSRLRTTAKRLGILSFWTAFGEMGMVVAIYFQEGCFEGCAIWSALFFSYCAFLTQQFVLSALEPIYSLQKRPMRRFSVFLTAWNVLISLSCFGSAVAMVVTGRDDSQIVGYNYAACGLATSFYIAGLVDNLAMFWAAEKLHSKLLEMEHILGRTLVQDASEPQSITTARGYQTFKRKLRLLQLNAMGIIVPYTIFVFMAPIVPFVFGSFPFFWVILYCIMVFSAMFFTVSLLYFVKPTSGKLEVTSTKNNDNGNGVSPVPNTHAG
jgi:hypothetical protein